MAGRTYTLTVTEAQLNLIDEAMGNLAVRCDDNLREMGGRSYPHWDADARFYRMRKRVANNLMDKISKARHLSRK